MTFWLHNHQHSFWHRFNSFVNTFGSSVLKSVSDSYRKLANVSLFIYFSKAWVRSSLLRKLKIFSIVLKSGERGAMLKLIAPTVSKACFAFLPFCTGHPSWRNLLPFGFLHRLKVYWKCVLMKSENIYPVILPSYCWQNNTFLICYCDNEMHYSSSRAPVK